MRTTQPGVSAGSTRGPDLGMKHVLREIHVPDNVFHFKHDTAVLLDKLGAGGGLGGLDGDGAFLAAARLKEGERRDSGRGEGERGQSISQYKS